MSLNIDYSFISDLEGGRVLRAYVPNPGGSNSGVTVATGFDLGQRNEADLQRLGLSQSLITKLKPYLSIKSVQAGRFLANNPLTITPMESEVIDRAVKAGQVRQLQSLYAGAPNNKNKVAFSTLPEEAQTVIASVAFQYGTGLNIKTPGFWDAVTSQDWKRTVEELRDFKDAYPTRRNKEADLLERILP
ncbi:pesticin C-terminus-like muramidase [Marinobacter sp. LN3S78]|uniref:pesticin C-terminus-like muramidase n=1 Tax=Marinobacter sp. LN3S78 TaxID=3382300 RepID=UPI00387AE296